MFFETNALVLKATKSVNNDIFLTLFTEKGGKLEAVANGAKSPKSSLAACAKPFVFGQFVLNTKSKVMKIDSVDIQESHFRITDDLESLAYGNYFLELCHLTTYPAVIDRVHYRLIVELIDLLIQKDTPYALLRAAYLVKLTKLTGHAPTLIPTCAACGMPNEIYQFSIQEGGLVCKSCSKKVHTITLNQSFVQVIQFMLEKDIQVLVKTKIHPNYLTKIIAIFEAYLEYHLDLKPIKSRNFLESLF